MSEYYFIKKWDENTDISWWNSSRKELNKIISLHNIQIIEKGKHFSML